MFGDLKVPEFGNGAQVWIIRFDGPWFANLSNLGSLKECPEPVIYAVSFWPTSD